MAERSVSQPRPEPQRERRVLVTGAAGFIGFHVARRLLDTGDHVLGLDDLNDYYDPTLKAARLALLEGRPGFAFVRGDVADAPATLDVVARFRPTHVVHLAAQAGVRYSLDNPAAYLRSNIDGFLAILETIRRHPVAHLIYASSSSVYGNNKKVPFAEADPVDKPISLYAATKRSNELMAETYAHLFGIAATGLRFFTVYGPWGRPDMAYFRFTKAIIGGEAVEIFGDGTSRRDLTFVDDVVAAIETLLPRPPVAEGDGSPHRILNIGGHRPVELNRFVDMLADIVGEPVRKRHRDTQPGDVDETCADTSRLRAITGESPDTTLEVGLTAFVDWYRSYHDRPQA